MFRRLSIVVTMTALVLFASSAGAQGFHVGAGIGNTFFSSEFSDATDQLQEIDENSTAWKIFGGFSPKQFFGLEGGYRDFGEVAGGTWTISCRDNSAGTEGVLNEWRVEIGYEDTVPAEGRTLTSVKWLFE